MPIAAASQALAAAVTASQPVAAGTRTGIVTGTGVTLPNGNTGVTVNISGSDMDLPYHSTYVPAMDDVVNVDKTANAWLVTGTTNGSRSVETNPSRGYLDIAVMGVGTLGPTSATTELELTNLQLTNLSLYAGRTYMITISGFFIATVAADRFVIMAHQGGFASAGVTNSNFVSGTTLGNDEYFSWPWTPTIDAINTNMRFGLARNSGTGTMTLSGSPGGGVVRTWSSIEDISSSSTVRIV